MTGFRKEWTSFPQSAQSSFPMTDPWCWYIYLHDWVIYGVNVGKYSSTMDPMGLVNCYFSWAFLGLQCQISGVHTSPRVVSGVMSPTCSTPWLWGKSLRHPNEEAIAIPRSRKKMLPCRNIVKHEGILMISEVLKWNRKVESSITGLVFTGKYSPETHGFLPSNWSGFPVKIVPSSNSMIVDGFVWKWGIPPIIAI